MLENVARTSKTLPKGRARHPLVRADPVARQLSAPHIVGTDLQTRGSPGVQSTTTFEQNVQSIFFNVLWTPLIKPRIIYKIAYHTLIPAFLFVRPYNRCDPKYDLKIRVSKRFFAKFWKRNLKRPRLLGRRMSNRKCPILGHRKT